MESSWVGDEGLWGNEEEREKAGIQTEGTPLPQLSGSSSICTTVSLLFLNIPILIPLQNSTCANEHLYKEVPASRQSTNYIA